ncbi:hypothetical protein PIB30_096059, partial [Stylosanthes scabra]|nr:hypothetical protein [Stylosanthes scabra]
MDNEEENKAEDEEGENDWLYELLKEESEEESDEEEESELAEEEDMDKGKIFFINTLFKEKKSEEEIPIKCEDPGPCLITCKIRGEKEQKEAWKARKEKNRATGQKQSYSVKYRELTPRGHYPRLGVAEL